MEADIPDTLYPRPCTLSPTMKIALGITGGIAAYKAAELVRLLQDKGIDVQVVMTEDASRFVGPATFAALSGQPVAQHVFDDRYPLGAHIELSRGRQVLCVAPATANFLAKAAHGLADDLLSTLYLGFPQTVIVAPAMNVHMWEHAAVQRNISQLRDDGVVIVEPEPGWLSCRDEGQGRMAEPDTLWQAILQCLPTASQPTSD